MSSHPMAVAVVLTVALVLSRPWLEARRPIVSLVLILGFVLGTGGVRWLGPDLQAGFTPILALATGWLALLAAEAWNLSTLRRAKAGRRLGLSLLCAVAAAVVMAAVARWLGLPAPWAAGLLLAAACIAQDPEAARDALSRATLPDARARLAPSGASVSLGAALLFSSLAQVPAVGGSATTFHLAPDATSTITLGVLLGVIAVLMLRLAQGSGMLLALLAALAVTGCGVALWLDLSACALLFCAGVILANDASRRDLVFALLRQWERPALCAMLLLAGASLGVGLAPGGYFPAICLMTAGVLLARFVIFGARWREAMALPPLVLVLTLSTATRPEPAAIAMALVAGEVILLPSRRPR